MLQLKKLCSHYIEKFTCKYLRFFEISYLDGINFMSSLERHNIKTMTIITGGFHIFSELSAIFIL